MEKGQPAHVSYTCSFCGKRYDEVKRLIAGPKQIYICDECVQSCNNLLRERSSAPRENQFESQGYMHHTPVSHVDTATLDLQTIMQNAQGQFAPTDPHYHLLPLLFRRSTQRLQSLQRPASGPWGNAANAEIAESYREALMFAHREKEHLQTSAIGTTYLLLALLRLPAENTVQILDTLRIDRDQLIQEVEAAYLTDDGKFFQMQDHDPFVHLSGMTDTADQAITFAFEEAQVLLNPSVGAEHILLGLLHLDQSDIDVFKRAGLHLDEIRQIVSDISH